MTASVTSVLSLVIALILYLQEKPSLLVARNMHGFAGTNGKNEGILLRR